MSSNDDAKNSVPTYPDEQDPNQASQTTGVKTGVNPTSDDEDEEAMIVTRVMSAEELRAEIKAYELREEIRAGQPEDESIDAERANLIAVLNARLDARIEEVTRADAEYRAYEEEQNLEPTLERPEVKQEPASVSEAHWIPPQPQEQEPAVTQYQSRPPLSAEILMQAARRLTVPYLPRENSPRAPAQVEVTTDSGVTVEVSGSEQAPNNNPQITTGQKIRQGTLQGIGNVVYQVAPPGHSLTQDGTGVQDEAANGPSQPPRTGTIKPGPFKPVDMQAQEMEQQPEGQAPDRLESIVKTNVPPTSAPLASPLPQLPPQSPVPKDLSALTLDQYAADLSAQFTGNARLGPAQGPHVEYSDPSTGSRIEVDPSGTQIESRFDISDEPTGVYDSLAQAIAADELEAPTRVTSRDELLAGVQLPADMNPGELVASAISAGQDDTQIPTAAQTPYTVMQSIDAPVSLEPAVETLRGMTPKKEQAYATTEPAQMQPELVQQNLPLPSDYLRTTGTLPQFPMTAEAEQATPAQMDQSTPAEQTAAPQAMTPEGQDAQKLEDIATAETQQVLAFPEPDLQGIRKPSDYLRTVSMRAQSEAAPNAEMSRTEGQQQAQTVTSAPKTYQEQQANMPATTFDLDFDDTTVSGAQHHQSSSPVPTPEPRKVEKPRKKISKRAEKKILSSQDQTVLTRQTIDDRISTTQAHQKTNLRRAALGIFAGAAITGAIGLIAYGNCSQTEEKTSQNTSTSELVTATQTAKPAESVAKLPAAPGEMTPDATLGEGQTVYTPTPAPQPVLATQPAQTEKPVLALRMAYDSSSRYLSVVYTPMTEQTLKTQIKGFGDSAKAQAAGGKVTVYVDGFASIEGSESYNEMLSEMRASNTALSYCQENRTADVIVRGWGETDEFGEKLTEGERSSIESLTRAHRINHTKLREDRRVVLSTEDTKYNSDQAATVVYSGTCEGFITLHAKTTSATGTQQIQQNTQGRQIEQGTDHNNTHLRHTLNIETPESHSGTAHTHAAQTASTYDAASAGMHDTAPTIDIAECDAAEADEIIQLAAQYAYEDEDKSIEVSECTEAEEILALAEHEIFDISDTTAGSPRVEYSEAATEFTDADVEMMLAAEEISEKLQIGDFNDDHAKTLYSIIESQDNFSPANLDCARRWIKANFGRETTIDEITDIAEARFAYASSQASISEETRDALSAVYAIEEQRVLEEKESQGKKCESPAETPAETLSDETLECLNMVYAIEEQRVAQERRQAEGSAEISELFFGLENKQKLRDKASRLYQRNMRYSEVADIAINYRQTRSSELEKAVRKKMTRQDSEVMSAILNNPAQSKEDNLSAARFWAETRFDVKLSSYDITILTDGRTV
jgi:hypothetical protein